MRRWIKVAMLAAVLSAPEMSLGEDWPMLAHDSARSGATPIELHPPFQRKWYRLFTDEGLMSGVQPIVSDGKVFIGTLRGRLHALDAETGKEAWSYQAGGAVLHAAGWAEGKVIFGSADGAVQAVNSGDGALAWEVQTGAAVWNAPALHQGIAYIGSRDGQLYAIEARTGEVKWVAPTDGPLLGSPAVDARRGRVYAGSENMRVYAFGLSDGERVWRSEPLPGVSLRGYHPVIAPDGSVLVTSAPGISVDTFQELLLRMAKEVFGDFASWRHSKEANAVLREENFALMENPETYTRQIEFLRQRLTEEPAYQTFFVLDPQTGKQKFVAPIVYSESMNGPGAPAVLSAEGKVLVKYQALLRSRYEHYSPFLNVGELDTTTGEIKPVMDQTRTYGWFDSLLLVHDEQSQLALSGQVLVNTHQDNVNGLDLRNLEGFLEPFCRNIHEPKAGEAVAIWTRLLNGQPLPSGKEWLSRGTAVYGGGSVLDTSIAIAGDSFYYLPTHELSAGVALIAYRMHPEGSASKETQLAAAPISPEDWKKVQELPWDWDTLEHRRLTNVLEALPGKTPGTRAQPLAEAAERPAIAAAELDRIIWEAPKPAAAQPKLFLGGLESDLGAAVDELISREWQPLLFPAGKFPEESYRFFCEPTETLYTLALAHPHLSSARQTRVQNYVTQLSQEGGALSGPVGQRMHRPNAGEVRSAFTPPPTRLVRVQEDILRADLARLYPLWLWAHVSGDWGKLKKEWPNLGGLLHQRPSKMEEDCRNGYLGGLIAYCRIAQRLGDTNAVEAGLQAARNAMQERLRFEWGHTRGGLIWQVPKMRSIFARWRFLTPETGRLLQEHAGEIQAGLMRRYVDYHRPTWWLAWNVETMMRNECPYEFPTMSMEVFTARSAILNESAEKLALWIDRPWCRADEYYIQKLALTLNAAKGQDWRDVRQ